MSELVRYCTVQRISSLLLARTEKMEIKYFPVSVKVEVQLIQDTYRKLLKFANNSKGCLLPFKPCLYCLAYLDLILIF